MVCRSARRRRSPLSNVIELDIAADDGDSGPAVGLIEGESVGPADGLTEGERVGVVVGLAVLGASVGVVVGLAVGPMEGKLGQLGQLGQF